MARKLAVRLLSALTLAGIEAAALNSCGPSLALAASVVGSGTPESCTEAALDLVLGCTPPTGAPPVSTCSGGAKLTFNCGPLPLSLTVTTSRTIAASTTIDGGNLIALSGQGKWSIFTVTTGVTLELDNVTISGGYNASVGGAISNIGVLVITNSIFSGNSAVSNGAIGDGLATGNGGAIENWGTLTITNSTFSGNSSVFGGAISNTGTVTVTDSTFSDNTVGPYGGFSGDGGAIANTGRLTVTNSTFSGNSAGNGGAIANEDNSATASVTNSTFSSNRGWNGGAIANSGGSTLTVINSTLSANGSGANSGGAIANSGGSTLTVTDSTFSDNSSNNVGGAISNDVGTLMVTSSTFSGSRSVFGGAIYNFASPLTVTSSTFASNSAFGSAGAIVNLAEGTASVTSSTFSGNTGGYDGGGAIDNDGTLAVTNSTFSANSAGLSGATADGGAIGNDRTLMVINSTFSGNGANRSGGTIYNKIGASATIANTIVANSSAGGNCSGVIIDGGHNLDSDGTCGVGPATDPMLDPGSLADNGGPTQTIALVAGSPAIEAGGETICAAPPVNNRDQRGFVRPGIGAAKCSIGAYEFNSPSTPTSCVGDCNANGSVTVDELLTMVNIALDNADASACGAGDANHDGQITIDEILTAVNNALNGCATGEIP